MNRLAIPLSLALLFAACGPKAPATNASAKAAASPAASAAATAVAAAPSPTPEKTPVEPDLPFPTNDAFRDKQPTPGPTPAFKQPKMEIFPLVNGITAYVVERHELPTVSISLVVDGGSMDDPKGKEGRAALCTDLLSQGTKKLDRLAFDKALADIGSGVSASAGRDEIGVAMSSLTKHVDETLDLWTDTIFSPALDEKELALDVKMRRDWLRSMRGNPAAIAGRLATSVVFGPESLYGRVDTESSVGNVTVDDCKALFQDRLVAKGARLFVVGDLTKQQVKEKLGRRLAALKGAAKPLPKPGEPKPLTGRVFFVDVPGAQQSVIRVMERGPVRKAPDYFPTALMSEVLGGDFASRINMNLREQHGYAYGAFAGFSYLKNDGVFVASSSVRTDVTAESLHELLSEIHRIRESDVTPAELDREKKGAILALPADFATGQQILGTYRSLLYFGLPLDYYDHFVPRINAVTIKEVRQAAEKHVKPDDLVVLIVGDAKTVVPKIQALMDKGEVAKGALVQLDVDGKPIAAP